MLTFNQIYSETQTEVSDTSAASLVLIKRAINQGMRKFGAVLNRDWRVSYKTFGLVADQQYYQMPEDAIRIKNLRFPDSNAAPPIEVQDEDAWNELNIRTQTGAWADAFFVRGNDEFGLYPIPSTTVAAAGIIGYERRIRDMSVDDYSTGTVAVTNGSQVVTGTGTTFTQAMVGRTLLFTDANGDGMGYKVVEYTSATSIKLENNYGGNTASGMSYILGEVPDIPEEYHESLVDYAMYRYLKRRKDKPGYSDSLNAFKNALAECQSIYSSKSTSNYFRAPRISRGYVHHNRDLTVS